MNRFFTLALVLLFCTTVLLSGWAGEHYNIAVTCWLDANQNGMLDDGEQGIPGVLYRLETEAGDSLIAKHVTNSQGKLVFDVELWGGTFRLFVDPNTLPEDYEITTGELEYFFQEIHFDHFEENQTMQQQSSLAKSRGKYLNYSLGIYSRTYEPEGDPVITPPEPLPGNTLVFVEGSPTFKQGLKPGLWGWDNTVDGDTSNARTDAALFPFSPDDCPWALYKFADEGMYKFNYVTMQRVIRDYFTTQVLSIPLQFEILVSTTGMEAEDFESAGTFTFDFFAMPFNDTWFKCANGYVTAQYIKLKILQAMPYHGVAKSMGEQLYMMITEFNVQTGDKQGAVPAVEKQDIVMNGFNLMNNYPNPFNPMTTIQYNLPSDEFVELTIYNINGKEVERLVSEYQTSGMYTVNWDASHLTSGTYLYKLAAGDFTATKRMILVK